MQVQQNQKTFTLEEVAQHNKDTDAWIVIDSVVYDITKFAMLHPGGKDIILQHKGTDATKVFWDHHHSSVLSKYQSKLKIGLLQGHKELNKLTVETENSFGNLLPYCEPHWMQGQFSPYYKETHIKWMKKLRRFFEEEWHPQVEKHRLEHDCPRWIDKLFAKSGIQGVILGQPWNTQYNSWEGPENFDFFHQVIAYHESCRQNCIGHEAVHNGNKIGLPAILHFGSEYLKDWIIPQVLRGEKRICLAISEPFGASDVANLKTLAKKEGDFYIVNGIKKWITGGYIADYFTTAVRTGGPGMKGLSMLLIERNTPGFKIKPMNTQGGDKVTYLIFENVKVPCKNLIGEEDSGFLQIMYNFNPERIQIIVSALSLARWCFSESLHWAIQRDSFGKKLHNHQAVRMKLANMAKRISSCEAWIDSTIYQLTQMEHFEAMKKLGSQIALLKIETGQVLEFCAREATHIFGGSGLINGGPGQMVELIYRNVTFCTLTGGAEDVLLDFAARDIIKKSNKAQKQYQKLSKL